MDKPIDEQLVDEQHFEIAMQMVEDKEWLNLSNFLKQVSDGTVEAVRESLNAEDAEALKNAEPAPHDSQNDEMPSPVIDFLAGGWKDELGKHGN